MNFLSTTTFQSFWRGWFTVLLLLSGALFFPCFFNPLALRALSLSHLWWAEGEGKSVTLNGLFVLWVFFLFPLSCSIKPHGNNRWERFKSGIFCCIRIDFTLLPCFLTPSPYGHSPYLICDEQRERRKASLWTAFLFCEDFSYISLRRIGGEGWYLDMFSLLRIFFNPSVTTCHLPYILRCKTQGRSVEIFR